MQKITRDATLGKSLSWSDSAVTTSLLLTEAVQLVTATSQPKVDRPDNSKLGAHAYPGHLDGIWLSPLSSKPLRKAPLVGCILRVEDAVGGAYQRRDAASKFFGNELILFPFLRSRLVAQSSP